MMTPTQHRGWLDVAAFASLVLLALALVPAGAHLFELPNKLGLSPEQYMIVQQIYRGWALFGTVIYGALLALLAHTWLLRAQPVPFLLSLSASAGVAATQVLFWAYTYPANALTSNWTTVPADFETVRRQWEYSHAVNAGLTFASFCALTLSILLSRREWTAAARAP